MNSLKHTDAKWIIKEIIEDLGDKISSDRSM